MTDDPFVWMIPGGALLAVILYLIMRGRSDRKRDAHFAVLAAHRGAIVEATSEYSRRFSVDVDGRKVDVRDIYRAGGGSRRSGASYLMTATALRGRAWELHSVIVRQRFRAKAGEPFERRFKVEDLGLPMPDRWLSADVRAGIEAVFALGIAAAVDELDAGELVHRAMASPVEVNAETLDALLERHVALASAIERARSR
ncbi:MAG TPA: hypothetical protein VE010_20180 [Thermoanaerobaculia bacterium]|nr:hypothetical protein [Thermoanaerobaculia bacterium]